MHIAIVTPEFVSENNFDGGLANYTYKLAKWLLSQNHTIKVFIPIDNEQKNGIIENDQFEGIVLCRVKIEDYKWKINYYLKRIYLQSLFSEKQKIKITFLQTTYQLNKKIKLEHLKSKFDIIHYPHLGGLALFKPKNIPVVVRLSSSTALCHQMGGYGGSDLYTIMQEEIETKAMKKATTVFGPSKMVAKLVEKDIHKKIAIIETPYIKPNADLDNSVYNTYLLNKTYLLFFGSIGLIKGVGTIAEMIFELFEKQPNLHFVFVGKKLNNQINNVSVWEHLITQAKQHKQRIIHIDPLKHTQLFPIIQHAECVVLPSRIDNFPNTCIEAMANSKIVVGTIGNGFDQLIDDGKNGFVIPVDDKNALLTTIIKILNLPIDEKIKIEQLAKRRTDLLHPDIVLNELVHLYKQTIKNFKN